MKRRLALEAYLRTIVKIPTLKKVSYALHEFLNEPETMLFTPEDNIYYEDSSKERKKRWWLDIPSPFDDDVDDFIENEAQGSLLEGALELPVDALISNDVLALEDDSEQNTRDSLSMERKNGFHEQCGEEDVDAFLSARALDWSIDSEAANRLRDDLLPDADVED